MKNIMEAIEAVHHMNATSGISQNIYAIEECSELIKELTKELRNKGNKEAIFDEACDVLTTVLVLLHGRDVKWEDVKDRIIYKCNRAVTRFEDHKEV